MFCHMAGKTDGTFPAAGKKNLGPFTQGLLQSVGRTESILGSEREHPGLTQSTQDGTSL